MLFRQGSAAACSRTRSTNQALRFRSVPRCTSRPARPPAERLDARLDFGPAEFFSESRSSGRLLRPEPSVAPSRKRQTPARAGCGAGAAPLRSIGGGSRATRAARLGAPPYAADATCRGRHRTDATRAPLPRLLKEAATPSPLRHPAAGMKLRIPRPRRCISEARSPKLC